ncbi:hypothetical protein [Nocardiopsis tropica]|uniref:Transposase n=1 Tax=Nocardiopsis tropica TaxID=109330 RepID=A0ABV1ZZV9_9ACTN
MLELMNSEPYAELPPAQIWARELDEGRYHCSVSTMYRILRSRDQAGERGRTATHPPKTVPELQADAPGQMFTWDITRPKGPRPREYFHAYVVIDIYSRYVAAHTVERAATLARTYAAYPERFCCPPQPPRLPETVWINDPAKRREAALQIP